jgi:AraC-like DNA-binding protein
MNLELLNHICKLQNELYRIPFHIYEGTSRLSSFEQAEINCDLIFPFFAALTDTEATVNYILTSDLLLIGYIKDISSYYKIIIGPVAISNISDDNVKNLILSSNKMLQLENASAIKNYFNKMSKFSLDQFLHLVCIINGYINQEITTTNELSKKGIEKDVTIEARLKMITLDKYHIYDEIERRNNYDFETEIMFYISQGMTEKLDKIHSFSSHIGSLGSSSLRHYKNASIILNAISLRAAIIGGLDPETCYQLGEVYLNQIEACTDIESLSNIAKNLVTDYCSRVKLLHRPTTNHAAINKAIHYIADNYQKRLTVEEIAKEVGMSKEYLSTKFKKVVGISIPMYINEQKTQEAKQLLAFTDMSLSEIAEFLSFSSQSYFQSIFKKNVGCTPLEYRSKKSVVKDV